MEDHDLATKLLQDHFTAALIALLALAGCEERSIDLVSEQRAAIAMARTEVLTNSREMHDHISIDPKRLTVSAVKHAEGEGGWHVTLVQDDCTYMVFAYPGHELDVTGISAGCFTKP